MSLRLEVLPAEGWADAVAAALAEAIAARPDLRLCLPTGSTPAPAYERLPAALAARGIDAGDVVVVLLDEYLGVPVGHPARCDATLRRQLLDRLPRPPAFVAFAVADEPGGADQQGAEDAALAACRAMDGAIAEAGGLDVAVLGLGANGHVGMNEPGTPADALTRPVALAASTIEAARAYGIDPPPTRGLTLGIAELRRASEIWLLVRGEAKAAILARALEGPVSSDCPASLLRGHPGLRVLADEPAAAVIRSGVAPG